MVALKNITVSRKNIEEMELKEEKRQAEEAQQVAEAERAAEQLEQELTKVAAEAQKDCPIEVVPQHPSCDSLEDGEISEIEQVKNTMLEQSKSLQTSLCLRNNLFCV